MVEYNIIAVSDGSTVELINNPNMVVIESNTVLTPGSGNITLLNHNYTHFSNGSDPISPADIGAQPSGNYIVEGDHRLTNSRYPNSHKSSHASDGSDPLTPADIGAQPSGNYSQYPVEYGDLSSSSTVSLNTSKRVARAWINYNGISRVIRDSFNVSSVTYSATGQYIINFIDPFPDTNYSVIIFARDYDSDNYISNLASLRANSAKTTSSISVTSCYIRTGVLYDSPEYNVVIF